MQRRGQALLVLTAGLVGVLAVWAAAAGPDRVIRRVGERTPASPAQATRPGVIQPLPRRPQVPGATNGDNGWVSTVMAIVLGLLLLVVVAMVVAALVALLADRRLKRRVRDAPEVDSDASPIAAVAAAMRADAGEQAALLEGDTPRNGVVACWYRFEQQAASAGLARRPAETSSEFTLRLLDLVEADASAVGRLAALFREARFSEHELTEDDRSRAREALAQIHAQVGGLLSVRLR